MAQLRILTMPHPILAKTAREVRDDEFGPELEQLLSDMAETMYAAPGVGLAAPQIGDPVASWSSTAALTKSTGRSACWSTR